MHRNALIMLLLNTQDAMGWRSNARRILLYASDSDFHFAGDGKVQLNALTVSTKITIWYKFLNSKSKHMLKKHKNEK